MILQINMTDSTPIYIQIRNQIVMGIADGKIALSQPLPSVRQLADELGVNMMTVNKAYALLKSEGYIETDRRHGTKVCSKINFSPSFSLKLDNELEMLIAQSRVRGMEKETFLKKCADIFESFESKTQLGAENSHNS